MPNLELLPDRPRVANDDPGVRANMKKNVIHGFYLDV